MGALDTRTLDPAEEARGDARTQELALTVLGHPDLARVGEVAVLDTSAPASLSRTSPSFSAPGTSDRHPLADPGISRSPITLTPRADGSVDVSGGPLSAGGVDLPKEARLSADAVRAGVVLGLGRTALLLRLADRAPYVKEKLGMIGESPEMRHLRAQILAAAQLDVPVLLRGETGSGKELVARALHDAGPRAARAYQAVNMGAIPATVAASELFGHVRGAFTGAGEARAGLFERADRGTLFLDEIGETPLEVQVMLLRVLETGVIQRVGGSAEERVDVRIVAATDADLEKLIASGGFRAPLLHRLAGYEIEVRPLRERREDLALLLVHFLREELGRLGAAEVLALRDPKDTPWLAPRALLRLLTHDWPGNVRQLRNVARQLAVTHHQGAVTGVDALLGRASAPPETRSSRRRPRDVGEEEIARALAEHQYEMEAAADALHISRASLYVLLEKSPRFRKAKDIPAEELRAAFDACGGDVGAMSARLQVSASGIRLRMKELKAVR